MKEMDKIMERLPKPGEFYRHFKNRLYQVIAVAKDTETEELMVVYQALYGDFGVFVRPLVQFVSEVDKEKYPDVAQTHRFEQVTPEEMKISARALESGGTAEPVIKGETATVRPAEAGAAATTVSSADSEDFYTALLASKEEKEDPSRRPNPYLMAFLDAESYAEKIEALRWMKGKIGQRELSGICEVLEIQPSSGPVEEQLLEMERYLETKEKYDGGPRRRGRSRTEADGGHAW